MSIGRLNPSLSKSKNIFWNSMKYLDDTSCCYINMILHEVDFNGTLESITFCCTIFFFITHMRCCVQSCVYQTMCKTCKTLPPEDKFRIHTECFVFTWWLYRFANRFLAYYSFYRQLRHTKQEVPQDCSYERKHSWTYEFIGARMA